MKRIVAFLLIFAMALSLCACGSKVPDGMNKETYSLGKDALKVMDDYLAGKIDIHEADEKITGIYDELGALGESLQAKGKVNGKIVDSNALMESNSNNLVCLYLSGFMLGIYGVENAFGVVPDCQEQRDFLAAKLAGE